MSQDDNAFAPPEVLATTRVRQDVPVTTSLSWALQMVFALAVQGQHRWLTEHHLLLATLCDPDVADLLAVHVDLDEVDAATWARVQATPRGADRPQLHPSWTRAWDAATVLPTRVTGLILLEALRTPPRPLRHRLLDAAGLRKDSVPARLRRWGLGIVPDLPPAPQRQPAGAPLASVILVNDDTIPMHEVLEAAGAAGFGWIATGRAMLTAHARGRGILGDLTPDEADARIARIRAFGSTRGVTVPVERG